MKSASSVHLQASAIAQDCTSKRAFADNSQYLFSSDLHSPSFRKLKLQRFDGRLRIVSSRLLIAVPQNASVSTKDPLHEYGC